MSAIDRDQFDDGDEPRPVEPARPASPMTEEAAKMAESRFVNRRAYIVLTEAEYERDLLAAIERGYVLGSSAALAHVPLF